MQAGLRQVWNKIADFIHEKHSYKNDDISFSSSAISILETAIIWNEQEVLSVYGF